MLRSNDKQKSCARHKFIQNEGIKDYSPSDMKSRNEVIFIQHEKKTEEKVLQTNQKPKYVKLILHEKGTIGNCITSIIELKESY